MTRRTRIVIGVTVAAIVVAAAMPSLLGSLPSSADKSMEVAGKVQAPLVTIAGPAISYPVPDFTVGIPTPAGASAKPASASGAARSGAASRQPVVSGLLTSVPVTEGSRVVTGQVVAQLDTRLLDLGVVTAEAAYARTRADAGVLDDTLDTLTATRASLAAARSKLTKALAKAVAGRASIAAQLAALQAAIPPGAPVPPPTVPPAPPTPWQIIAKLKMATAKLDAGIAQVRAGLAKLSTGSTKLATARTQVRNGRELLSTLAEGRKVAIDLAGARREAASVRAQVSGVVTFARPAGTVVMVGAPLVQVAPDEPVRVDTYLTSEQLARVHVGGDALVDFDSNPGAPLRGHITRIDGTVQVPPTSFPTGIVHLTRAVLVTITLDEGGVAPAGTPVDVTLPID